VTKARLTNVPLELPRCRDLDEPTVRALVQGAEELRLGSGEVVYQEGDDSDNVYFVLSGQLKRGDASPGAAIQQADLIGLLEVLSGEGRISTVSVSQEARLLRVTGPSLLRLIQDRPDVTEALVDRVFQAAKKSRKLLEDDELHRIAKEGAPAKV